MADNKRKFFLWAASNWDAISTITKIAITAAGGVMTGWAAKATELFSAYAPFSWIAAALVGALVTALILAAWSWFRAERIRAAFLHTASRDSIEFNPLDDQIIRRRIFIPDLMHPLGQPIQNKTFVGCEIIGPGAIFFGQGHIHNATIGACEAIKMVGNDVLNLPNKIIFSDCTFRDCKFFNLLFLCSDNQYQVMQIWLGTNVKWL